MVCMKMRNKQSVDCNFFNLIQREFAIYYIINLFLEICYTFTRLTSLMAAAIKNNVGDIFIMLVIKPFCVERTMTDRMKSSYKFHFSKFFSRWARGLDIETHGLGSRLRRLPDHAN